ncbi:ABC transporter ATP-binding protein [Spirilliplanes yamanashiensis]|uniref:ABC transporter ATP-binding protein n=1 Tax=Spirilliplanes yamanashiensis TaxID=42233 RepID=A0A8J4DI38_9ACTN|nr:ABC transporter ATP-binding protein [Spirilliplanes yamanashiensis]MDP9819393.1 ABC-2 type transport system ATP-binding protein [Spirilliplanes yamanashiensis]GIJ01783.1 ABC transporter ATP-binding protein [Spirilliplanes yamanashiensis]
MIEVRGLTKRYGDVLAVDDLSFDVQPGKVTGFLGPNGAGKSTTMRMMLGLDRPTSGTALVNGRPFAALAEPLREVGALLDPGSVHPGRSGRNHLRVAARTNGIPERRVEQAIELAGLGSAAGRRIKGYSLGMRQRLGIAAALLADPRILVFDEPINGLDLDGVRWIRGLLRRLADEGRTVLVSSHLLSEMQQTADRLVVIGRGRLIADATTDEILRGLGNLQVRVRTSESGPLLAGLQAKGFTAQRVDDNELQVDDTTAEQVGDLAHALQVPVHHLTEVQQSLEHAYIALTSDHVEYHGGRPEETR